MEAPPETAAKANMMTVNGTSHSGSWPERMRSRNTVPRDAIKMSTTDTIAAVVMTNETAPPSPLRRFLAYAAVSGFEPPSTRASVFSNTRTTPVKLSSNSSIVTLIWPRAGSFKYACLPLKPHSTTKWLKFQKRMQGKDPFLRSAFAEYVMPLAFRPYERAAFSTFTAFDPSRETPQSARTCSSGTHLP